MYKRIPFGDSGIAETLVGIAISLAYQPIVRRAMICKINKGQNHDLVCPFLLLVKHIHQG
jgi:hypothetical protein